jgi:hypothetical protein
MSVNIRRGTIDDLAQVQNANLMSLPENYQVCSIIITIKTKTNISFININSL